VKDLEVPTVASYCTTFLKPEMLHIYRQVTGLQRYETFIVAKERTSAERFPFPDIEMVPRKPRKNFIRRFWLKHVRHLPALYYRGEMQGMMKIFRRRRADLMHIYFGHTGVHLLPFIKGWGKPCVVSFHGADVMPREHQPEYDAQLRELLRVTPLVLARSLSLARRLEDLGCPPEKIRLNRTGIPLADYPLRDRRAPEGGEWHFVQACRLIPKKGIATALKAFAGFHREYPRARFTLAGEGPMKREIEELARTLGIAGAVELRGFLSQADLARLYGEAHFFVHPSEMTADQNQEGVPNSMLEAMATGLPVLATLHGGIPEAVQSGATGLLVPERDDAGLLRAMLDLAAEPDRAFGMGRAASESVRREFEQARQIEKLESYYDEARTLGAPLPEEEAAVTLPVGGQVRGHGAHGAHEPNRPNGPNAERAAPFAYLFERFPSFTQTFCFREVEEMVRQGMEPAIYSIREADEGSAADPSLLDRVRYLPREEALNNAVRDARAAHQIHSDVWDVFSGWGDRGDKTRLYEAAWLGLELKRRRIRHVHAHFAGMAARTAYWIKQFHGIGYSFTGHANDIFCETDFPVSLDELVKEARLVVTETDYSRDWLRRRCPDSAAKIERVYNGIHPGEFARADFSAEPPEIVSVGRLIEKKGFNELIQACATLRGIDYRCRIVGAGPLEEALRGQIAQAGLGNRISLEGARPEADVIEFLRGARLFALACARDPDGGSDNLPTVIMEAMAAGLPVVSTRVAGIPEMIEDGRNGRLLAEHDVPGFAGALEGLLRDPAMARRCGAAGRETVERKFATERTTSHLKHLLVRRAPVRPPLRALRKDPRLLREALLRLAGIR
jgi:colanic acid/amylovoran biosynthesis glycosyltransferase